MKLIFWNVRGLNDPLKHKEVSRRINNLNVVIVCLLETHIKEHNSQAVIDKFYCEWNWLHNYSKAYNGRIWLIWRNYIKVYSIAIIDQCVCCKVSFHDTDFYMSIVYASNDGDLRKLLWSHLLEIHCLTAEALWLIAGDFNIVADVSESSNSMDSYKAEMLDFANCMSEISAFDHIYDGPLFT
ncbi:hypothetical protein PTKIN_Ptkin11bG0037800 [Pterospermum kingtungense]